MKWQLIQVSKTEWQQDDSGYYTLIHYIKENCRKCDKACVDCVDGQVRLDIMDKDDMPVVSFQGDASDVRKVAVRRLGQLSGMWHDFSVEHASYIGAELTRCELMQGLYIQD